MISLEDIDRLDPSWRVPMDVVCNVASRIRAHTIEDSVALCDAIQEVQPAAMAHLVHLSRQGVSNTLLDHAFHLLMVVYASFQEVGVGVAAIDEEMLERAWAGNFAMGSYFANEASSEERARQIEIGVLGYPEPFLLAYLVGYLSDKLPMDGPTVDAEAVVAASKALLDCFVEASRRPAD